MLHDVMLRGAQILLWGGIAPMLLIVTLVSILFSALQAVVNIKDSASIYAARLIAIVAGLYFLTPSLSSSLAQLMNLILKVG